MSLSDSQPIQGPPPLNSPVPSASGEDSDAKEVGNARDAGMSSGTRSSTSKSDSSKQSEKPKKSQPTTPPRLVRRSAADAQPLAPPPAPPPVPPAAPPPPVATQAYSPPSAAVPNIPPAPPPPPTQAATSSSSSTPSREVIRESANAKLASSRAGKKTSPSSADSTKRVGVRKDSVAKPKSSSATLTGEHRAQQEAQRRRVPSWFASLIFHLVLLLVLALIPIRDLVSGPLTLMLGESGGESIAEFELGGAQVENNTLDTLELEPLDASVDPSELVEQLELPSISLADSSQSGDAQLLQNLPFGIRNGLTGRTGALKDALLAKYGGTAETEAAVELGLKWLAKQQNSDGSWSLTGPYSNGGSTENRTAATAMALNAFLGAGHTHLEGQYRENVKLGLEYLVLHQNSEGFYSTRPPSRHTMYAQAIATIAVIECYGLSKDEKYRASAMQAISFAEWSQSSLKGWRYYPREDADLSVTGWYVMALITAKMAGLPVDEAKLQSVNDYLDTVAYEDQTRYAYKDIEKPSLSMTAEGLLCRIYLGWVRSDPSLLRAVQDDLLTNKPALNERVYSVYYWYYATQVMHHVGGKMWDEWNQEMRTVLPAMQEKKGKEAGSWDPQSDMFGASGGRLYTTCLNLYCLEVYYRHLSIYDIQ